MLPFDITDFASRYLLTCEALSTTQETFAFTAFQRTFKEFGLPHARSDRLSGAWTFKGTRVPVKALFENLEDGATVEQFIQWFPGVTRGQVEAVLEHTAQSLTEV